MKESIQQQEETIFLMLLSLVVITIPFSSIANAWSILAFALWNLWIAHKYETRTTGQMFPATALCFAAVMVAGFLNTSNFTQALKLFEARYPIFVFPVLIYLTGTLWREEIIHKVLLAFAVITLTCAFITQGSLLYDLIREGEPLSHFFYWRYSNIDLSYRIGMHPTYLSMYAIFSITIIYKIGIGTSPTFSRVITGYLGIAYLSMYTLHLASKISLLTLTFTLILVIYDAYRHFRWRVVVALIPLVLGSIVLFNLQIFALKSRFESSYVTDTFKNLFSKQNTIDPDDDRSVAWKKSVEIIRENPVFGVGTGDVMDELDNKYRSLENSDFLIQKEIDSHNQFLEATVRNGFLGLIALLILYFWPFYKVGLKDTLYLSFIAIIAVTSLTENIIDRQKGAIFLGLMNSLLYALVLNRKRNPY